MTAPSSQHIEPFWQHIGKVFQYPAKVNNLITIGVLTVLGYVAGFIPGPGWLIRGAVWAATYAYCYGILAHTAKGNLEPPDGYFYGDNPGVAFQQFIMTVLMIFAVVIMTGIAGPFIGIIVSIFVLISLPIATMVLAIDESIMRALNPATWIDGIGRIGWPYLALLGILLMFLMTSGAVQHYIAGSLPMGLGTMAFQFLSIYFMIAMFYLLGYVIYQYHDEFGFELEQQQGRLGHGLADQRAMQTHPVVDEANALVAEGDAEGAKAVLKASLGYEGPLSPVAQRYLQLCELSGDKEGLLKVGEQQLHVHLANEEYAKAATSLATCLKAKPDFTLPDANASLGMAQHLHDTRQAKPAFLLCKSFIAQHPKHRDLPDHYFLAAKLLAGNFNKDAEAIKTLRALVKKFPDHANIEEFKRYLTMLESVNGG